MLGLSGRVRDSYNNGIDAVELGALAMRFTLGLLILLVVIGGCGPQLSKADLGTVVFEVPKLSGSDEPYKCHN
jgi:hypothetical protein